MGVRFKRLRKRSRPRKRFRVTESDFWVWGCGGSVVVDPDLFRLNFVLFLNKRDLELLLPSPVGSSSPNIFDVFSTSLPLKDGVLNSLCSCVSAKE